jgi:hypothetical protein
MNLLLSLSLLLPQQATPAETLDAALLTGHPGLYSGDFDEVRADWLTALERDLGSPLAATAVARLAELEPWCSEGLPPARLTALLEGAHDGAVARGLQDLLLTELRRSRFAVDRPSFGDDLYADWIRDWHVLGPVGPLGHPSALRAVTAEPEFFLGTRTEPHSGLEVSWLPLTRQANQFHIRPDRRIRSGQGSLFVAAMVEGTPGLATLEVEIDENARVWWNHAEVMDLVRTGLTDSERLHRVVVEVRPGWNLLMVQAASGSNPFLGARLLDRQGRITPTATWSGGEEPPALPDTMGAPGLALTAPMPEGKDPWSRILAMHMERLRNRPDLALAMPRPEEMDQAQTAAWLLARHEALQASFHLPADIDRQRTLAVEAEMEEAGVFSLSVAILRLDELLDEDRREDAAELLATLEEKAPGHLQVGLASARVALAFDPSGTLAKAGLLDLHERFPTAPEPAAWLADIAREHGDRDGEERFLRLSERHDDGSAAGLIQFLTEGGPAAQEEASELLARLHEEEPAAFRQRELKKRLLRRQGEDGKLLAMLEQDARHSPATTGALRQQAELFLRDGKEDAARQRLTAALQLDPGDHDARRLLALLGDEDPAARFFAAFAPDVSAAATRVLSDQSASTAKPLDSGMVYFWPDGSYRYRVHDLNAALNRRGTEVLHELPAIGATRTAVVHKTDGARREPHLVDETWVMPHLDPGDRIEMVYDRDWSGTPGLAPMLGGWFFRAMEQEFGLSRLAVFVPAGLPGDFVMHDFDGSHEVLPWEGGEVHLFTREDNLRVRPEPAMPSEREVLPWIDYGADTPLADVVAFWQDWYPWQSAVPADIEVELRAFLDALDLPTDPLKRAEAIHAAVDREILSFAGDGDVTDVWTLKRGNPTGLTLALMRLADLPVTPGVTSGIAPRLHPDPAQPFPTADRFSVPVLHLAPATPEGEATWLMLVQRGQAFGTIPTTAQGAEALLLVDDGHVLTELPAAATTEWTIDTAIEYRLQRDDSALVEGRFTMAGSEGALVREQLQDLSPEQLEQAKAQVVAGLVPGLDLDAADFPGLDEPGAPWRMTFRGRVPGFILRRGDMVGARLNLQPAGIANQLGAGEREFDVVMQQRMATREQVTILGDGAWELDYGPETARLRFDGMESDFEVEKDLARVQVTRRMVLDGLRVEASAVPAFLEAIRAQEQEEQRALRLFPIPEPLPDEVALPDEPEEEAVLEEAATEDDGQTG